MSTPTDRYEAICDASPDAILLVDGAGRITYANARTADLFGYDPEGLRGEKIELLVPESKRAGHADQRERYMADPETRPMGVSLELAARREDGTTFPVDVSLSPMDEGEEVMAVVRDVSEREALEKKYRTILETVPDPVVVADAATGEIVEVNEHVTELLGYDADELVGQPQSRLHPEAERARYRDLFGDHVDARQGIYAQFPDGSALHVETKTGELIPVEINARVFELEDRQLITGVFRDISARKEYERRLRALHETTRELLTARSREEIATLVAEAADTTLGFASNVVRLVDDSNRLVPEAVTQQARADMGARPDYALDGESPAARVYEREEMLAYDDVRAVDDDHDRGDARAAMYLPISEGVISIVDTDAGAFTEMDVELARILAANADTALARLVYERELERQNERLDEFASVVSHDLRNPLNVAQGWLDVVREEAPNERLDRVADALDRMDEIIDDTLTLARQGRTVAEPRRLDATRLARECWAMVETGDARLVVDEEFELHSDPTRLQHVFENLFRNAVEHGDGSVTVTVGPIDGAGFYVEDDGPGIPADEREAVFGTGYTTAADGTGFGLTIVRQVAEAHGWDVGVTEGRDGGARFEFRNVEIETTPAETESAKS